MATLKSMSGPETRIFKGFWQDGALDLSAGVALLVTGVFWLTGPAVGQSLAPVIALALYPILRSKVTEPRLGYVRFSAERRSRLRFGNWLMLAIGVATLGLGVGFYFMRAEVSSIAKTLVPGLPAALLGLMALGGAAILGLRRFQMYALALVVGGGVVVVVEAHPGWALLAGGVVVTASGLVLMLRFVREYPVATSETE